MAKEYAKQFYLSKEWRACRDAYYKYRCGKCERCGDPGKIVHHKKHITPKNISNPKITLNWDNLELLCEDCHNKEHKSKKETRYTFDNQGNLVAAAGDSPRGANF